MVDRFSVFAISFSFSKKPIIEPYTIKFMLAHCYYVGFEFINYSKVMPFFPNYNWCFNDSSIEALTTSVILT